MRKFIYTLALVLALPLASDGHLQISSKERKEGSLVAKGDEPDDNKIEYQSPFEIEPTAIVNGCVNAITGHYMSSETDYYLPGVEPIFAQKSYISANTHDKGPFGRGWSRNYFGHIYYYTEDRFKYPDRAKVYDDNASYEYGGYHQRYHLFDDNYNTLVTNYFSGKISAATNIFNNILDFEYVLFTRSTGETLIYDKIKKNSWYLSKEFKLNGNYLNFSYDGLQLKNVEAFSESGHPLGGLEYEYGNWENGTYIIVKNRGQQRACYRMSRFKGKSLDYADYIVEAELQQAPSVTYEYETKDDDAKIPKIIRKNMPEGRFLEIDYYKKGRNYIGNDHYYKASSTKSPWIGRVKHLCSPVGTGNGSIITHRFLYKDLDKSSGGYTTVLDVDDHATRYIWNKQKRLSKFIKYSGKGTDDIYTTDTFHWGGHDFTEKTYLKSRTFEDATGKIHFMRSFNYDDHGNILEDFLHGNLTGQNHIPCSISENGYTQNNGCETNTKRYTYTDDNLVLTVHENGVTQIFEYVEGKNLIQAKFHESDGKIFKREFYAYDGNASLVQEIEDDGSSKDRNNLQDVTQRLIRDITLTLEEPVGLPLNVVESCLDVQTGEILHIKTTANHYCPDGRLLAKEIFDRNHQPVCKFTWEYDAHGNVLRETNALGQETSYRYDGNDNKIYEQGPDKRVNKRFHYDCMNRLVKVEEIYTNGTIVFETYAYNYLGQKVSSTDIYGNKTHYRYDDFGRLKKTIQPSIPDEKGNLRSPENYVEYNVFNTPKLINDFNGNSTASLCTIRGKPYRIFHPDGTQEEYVYNLNGTVARHTHKNGSYTRYKYDALQRVLSKVTKDPGGNILESHTYTYSIFHLLEERDTAGHTKQYRYDPAGRLVEIIKGDNRATYEYDAVDRLCKTTEYDGTGKSVSYIQCFDLLDRVIEERQEDVDGKTLTRVSYEYDEAGNRTVVTTYSDLGESRTVTHYDERHQPVEIIDPIGNSTHILYKYDHKNEYGQTVPYSESADPMGNITINVKDTHGRLASLILKNSLGEPLHKKNLYYDANGNKCRQENYATKGAGRHKKAVMTTWAYDCMNRLTLTTEAAGRPEQKQTELRYNAIGENSEIIKPDGIRIYQDYDLLGRLKQLHSSDASVDYTYSYDQNSNVIAVYDHVHQANTFKMYDEQDRLIKEQLGNQLCVCYEYDGLNNPRKLTLPDQSAIEYEYNGKRLIEVQRFTKENECLYSHKYTAYDLQNKLTEAQLIGNAGTVKCTYDPCGRPLKIHHHLWDEAISSYDKAGNILERAFCEPKQRTHCSYNYDDLYQLTKESGAANHTYAFDSLNNRIHKNGHKHKHNGLNQLLNDGKATYSYDANGNLTKKVTESDTVELEYDALDRLVAVIVGDRHYRYVYDAQNRRLAKNSLESTVNYLYLGQNEIGSYTQEGRPLEVRVLGLSRGAENGAAVAIELQDKVYAPLHDHIGNVTALIDMESGNHFEFYRFSAFGEEVLLNVAGEKLETSLNPWRFSSKRFDPETGFIYYGRRYYNPSTGRWITSDPLRNADGPNFYAFLHNRPLTTFDQYGLWTIGTFSFGTDYTNFQFARPIVKAIQFSAMVVDGLAKHLVPIPVVRDVLQVAGRTISGQGLEGFHLAGAGYNIYGHLGLEEPRDAYGQEHRIFIISGICTSAEEMRARAEAVSKALGGCNVHYYASASDGLLLDLKDANIRSCGLSLPGDQNFKDMMDTQIEAIGPNGRMFVYAHSQGGMLLDNYRMETTSNKDNISKPCKQIVAYSFGSARVLNSNHYSDAQNYISMRDMVPCVANPKNYFSALAQPRSDVNFIESKGLPFLDHGWDSKTYQREITKTTDEIRDYIWGNK